MTRTAGRISIPQNIPAILSLGTKVYKKHQTDGDTSQLSNLDGTSWTEVGPTIEKALAKHREAENLKNRMEEAYRERDLYMPAIKDILVSSRNLLKAHNQKNPKRLADWGFQIDDSVRTPKIEKTK